MSTKTSHRSKQDVQPEVLHRWSATTAYVRSLSSAAADLWEAELDVHVPAEPTASMALPLRYAVELIRQSGVAVAHLGCDVPLGDAFVMHSFEFGWSGGASPTLREGRWTGEASIRVSDQRWRRGRLDCLRVAIELFRGDTPVASGGGVMRCLAASDFRALRRNATPLTPTHANHEHEPIRQVTTEGHHLEARLAWNTADPLTFDHPLDHVPGLALIDAATTAAERLTRHKCQAFKFTFCRFTEFHPVTIIRAERQSSDVVAVAMTQTGQHTLVGSVRAQRKSNTQAEAQPLKEA